MRFDSLFRACTERGSGPRAGGGWQARRNTRWVSPAVAPIPAAVFTQFCALTTLSVVPAAQPTLAAVEWRIGALALRLAQPQLRPKQDWTYPVMCEVDLQGMVHTYQDFGLSPRQPASTPTQPTQIPRTCHKFHRHAFNRRNRNAGRRVTGYGICVFNYGVDIDTYQQSTTTH